MSEKRFNGRIAQKHAVQADWGKATNFIPMDGEIIVYDVDDLHEAPRLKVGDGETNVNDLPFATKLPVIDVTALPETDIEKDVFYRLTAASMYQGRTLMESYNAIVVNSLPSVGIPGMSAENPDKFFLYYAKDTGAASVYFDEAMSAEMGLDVGWHLLGEIGIPYGGVVKSAEEIPADDTDNVYVVVKESIKFYNGKWNDVQLSPAIIGVLTLPEVDIKKDAFYRTVTAVMYSGSAVDENVTIYVVDELPEVGALFYDREAGRNYAYYVVSSGETQCYCDEALGSMFGLTAGWHTFEETAAAIDADYGGIVHTPWDIPDHTETRYLVVSENIQYYKNGAWNNVGIASGSGAFSEVFNDAFLNQAAGDYSHAEGRYAAAIGIASHAEGFISGASGDYSHAEGAWCSAEGESSHAEGGETKAYGHNAHAEGGLTIAKGGSSHAEGGETEANGDSSHAEGYRTVANGGSSHSEGEQTRAEASNSHAEGYNSIAYGANSHAEGRGVVAYGLNSHAEGYGGAYSVNISGDANATTYYMFKADSSMNGHFISYGKRDADGVLSSRIAKVVAVDEENHTITVNRTLSPDASINESTANIVVCISNAAFGDHAHAEGTGVIAAGLSQHAQGEYNAIDPDFNADDTTVRGKYADIVGNGTGMDARSNAYALDWSGNAYHAGDVYVLGDGTNDFAGAKKLATEELVQQLISALGLPTPTTADAGKILRVNSEGKYELVAIANAEEATF